VSGSSIVLRVVVDTGAVCLFSSSEDGILFKTLGQNFSAREGKWIGAKVGLFALASVKGNKYGYVDCDWFRIE
jgi:hypothetical protein